MIWKKNKKAVSKGFRDLEYLPKERCGWDCTLASLAYGMRMNIDPSSNDLNAWAVRHGVDGGVRYRDIGSDALVLWHGTSRERAERIREHGLFHKKGLWTTTQPLIAHGFCRSRSAHFGAEGAVVCLVIDPATVIEGHDYDVEGKGDVLRFYHRLPADVVEYVLTHDEILFTGRSRARAPAKWPRARFKKRSGEWVPVQKIPVTYPDYPSYSSVEEFAAICIDRLMADMREITAIEVFSTLYALVDPWRALTHDNIIELIDEKCTPCRRRGKWQTFHSPSSDT